MQQNMHMKHLNIKIKVNLDKELKNIINKDNQYTIPIFIPHKGCKNECVFCNQRKISGKIKSVTVSDVDNEIKEYLKYFDRKNLNKKIQIAFFGGSFTGISKKEQIAYLEVANKYIKQGIVDSIRLSTRPDYISVDILKILKKFNVQTIELGVQSMDNDVLQASKRGHLRKHIIRASRLINFYGINLGHQLMIGLPNSTKEKEIYSIRECLKYNVVNLRIYPVYVINPSELYDMYISKKYVPLTLEEAINRTYSVVKECSNSDVKIIRIGLQSTSEITSNNGELVGPICDNFAEYVLARIALEKTEQAIIENLEKYKLKKEYKKYIEIYTSLRNISIVSGPKKINKKYLENKYNIDIKVKGE